MPFSSNFSPSGHVAVTLCFTACFGFHCMLCVSLRHVFHIVSLRRVFHIVSLRHVFHASLRTVIQIPTAMKILR